MHENCLFCKIANKEIPAHIVFENDRIIAFLDISQATRGHTLVIPKAHYETLLSTPKDLMHEVMDIAQQVGIAQMKKLLARGVNVLMNCYPIAGQSIGHFHVHVIPRYEKTDGLQITMSNNSNTINLPMLASEMKDVIK